MSRKHKLPIFYPHWNGNSNNFIPNGWIHLGILPQCGIYMGYLLIHYNEMSYMYVICLVFTTIAFLKRRTGDPSFSESRLKSFIINPISKQNFPRIRPWTFWSCTFFFTFEWLNTFCWRWILFFLDLICISDQNNQNSSTQKNPMTIDQIVSSA